MPDLTYKPVILETSCIATCINAAYKASLELLHCQSESQLTVPLHKTSLIGAKVLSYLGHTASVSITLYLFMSFSTVTIMGISVGYSSASVILLQLILSGDVELNPGPKEGKLLPDIL